MMSIRRSLLLCILLNGLILNCKAAYEDQVKKINSYMQDQKVAPNEVDLAFKKALEYRDNEATKKESFFVKRDQKLILLLDRFLELKPIREKGNNCGYESLEKIRGTADLFMSANKTAADKQRLINKIIRNFIDDHALKCDAIHPKDFERIYSQLQNTKLVKRVESFMYEAILQSEFKAIDPSILPIDLKTYYGKLYYNFIQEEDELEPGQKFQFLWFHDYEFIYKELVSHATKYGGKEENLKYLLEEPPKKDKVKVEEIVDELFIEYLQEPCKYYVEKLGPDVFFPAIWEGRFLRRSNPTYRAKEENAAYILGWAQFTNCFQFFTTMNKADVKSAITEVAMSNK